MTLIGGQKRTFQWALKRQTRAGVAKAAAIFFLVFIPLIKAAASANDIDNVASPVIEALGGNDLTEKKQYVASSADVENFSMMGSVAHNGAPKHVSTDIVRTLWSPSTGQFRLQLQRETFHPFAGNFDFAEAFDGEIATRRGPKDFRSSNDGALEAPYFGARQKQLWLSHPLGLLLTADEITADGVRDIDGRKMTALKITALGETWHGLINPETSLPYSMAVVEKDGLHGEIVIEVRFDDWCDADGRKVPFQLTQTANGSLVRRTIRRRIDTASNLSKDEFRFADALDGAMPDALLAGWGWSMSDWFLGRAAMGRGSEMRRETPVTFTELAPDVFHATGTSHHNLVIVGDNAIAVVDAPFYPSRSRAVLNAIQERWPAKAVKYVILSHHHADHIGGMREYALPKVEFVVPGSSFDFFEDIMGAASKVESTIVPVRGRLKLQNFSKNVEIIAASNSHADGMLVVYLPDNNLLFTTDLYSPGRPTQHSRYPAELLNVIRSNKLEVEKIAGAHGSGLDPLSRLESFAGKSNSQRTE